MGQKINPISLRLASSTKSFDNLWYNDYFYTKLISKDISLNQYINNFLKLMKLPSNRLSICHLPNTTKLYNFFCYPRQNREFNSRIYQVSSSLPYLRARNFKSFKNTRDLKTTKFQQSVTDLNLWQKIFTKKKVTTYFSNNSLSNLFTISSQDQAAQHFLLKSKTKLLVSKKQNNIFSIHNRSIDFWKNLLILQSLKTTSLKTSYPVSENLEIKLFFKNFLQILKLDNKSSSSSTLKSIKNRKLISLYSNSFMNIFKLNERKLKYKNYLENHLSKFYTQKIELIPFKISQNWQSANYFADEIVYLLERRVSFRRLRTRILKQISQNPKIRGIRITCSGRVGGKSKRAQRAKMESIKYGQTSLHVFSSKIDFSAKTASTALGSTGIKVWICYN